MPTPIESPAFPRHIVTAIVVAHDGARWLPRVIDGIVGQHRPPQNVIAVDTGSTDASPRLLADAFGEHNLIRRPRGTGFAAAVAYARNAAESYRADRYTSDADPRDWLWILHDDCEPAPDALVQLLRAAEEYPQAALIGPKPLGFFDRRHILDAGLSIAPDGRRWTGVDPRERDQGQHDGICPVLAVSSAGMLVRRDVWDALGGFDRAFRLMREDIDFGWRVNAAGHTVLFAPDAVVYHAEAAARDRRPIDVGSHRPHLLDRFGALYTLLVHARRPRLPLLWLRVVVECLLRAIGFLVAKMPGHAADEVRALTLVVSRPDRVLRGRRVRRGAARSYAELAYLFPQRRAVLRNSADTLAGMFLGEKVEDTGALSGRHRVVELGPTSEEMDSLELDGGRLRRLLRQPGVVLGLVLVILTVVAGRHLVLAGGLHGGALLPPPTGASDLWHDFTAAWHPVSTGSASAAPPYLAVLALLATVLFGHAPLAVTVLLLGSVPLAGITAYLAGRELVPSRLVRVWGAAAYATLPVLTGAVAAGRLGTAVAVALLPLFLGCVSGMTGTRQRAGTTRAAWTGALVLAVMTAFAPQSWVIAVVLALIWIAAALRPTPRGRWGRRAVAVRWLIVVAAPLVVLAPWSITALGHPGVLLSEAGLPGSGALASASLSPVDALLFRPGGPGMLPAWIGIGLLLAGLAALTRTTRRAPVYTGWAIGLVGFLLTVVLSRVHIQPPGAPATVVVWPGMATALMGAGVIAAALVGAEGARDRVAASAFGWRQPVAVLVTAAAAVAPVIAVGWWAVSGIPGPVSGGLPSVVPAYAVEQAETPAHPSTLVLAPGPAGSVAFTIVRDAGANLGDADVAPSGGSVDALGGVVASMLAGHGGDEVLTLSGHGVGFVVALPGIESVVSRTLDAAPGLTPVSVQSSGAGLWSVGYPTGRVTVRGPGAGDPVVVVGSGPVGATAAIPAGPSGRLLVLADAPSSGWHAELNGRALPATSYDGTQQAFTLPASGGELTLGYSSAGRWAWVVVEALLFVALIVMTLPSGRRGADDEDEAGLDERPPAAAGHAAAAPEPLAEPVPAGSGNVAASAATAVIPAQTPRPGADAGGAWEPGGYQAAAGAPPYAGRPSAAEPYDGTSYGDAGFDDQAGAAATAESAEAYQGGGYTLPDDLASEYGTGYGTRGGPYAEDGYAQPPYPGEAYGTGAYAAADPYAAPPPGPAYGDPAPAEEYGTGAYPAGGYEDGGYQAEDGAYTDEEGAEAPARRPRHRSPRRGHPGEGTPPAGGAGGGGRHGH